MSGTLSVDEIQRRLLPMMEWFHQFCDDNNIPYYMLGGTLLGAIRHKGFIPWDDDVDIGVPREDFDRMLLCAKSLSEDSRYVFESYHDGKEDFEYPFAKVYDTTTTLIENKRKKPKRGLYIDIFPIDGISGSTKEEALKSFKPIKKKLNRLAAITSDVREGRAWWKNMIVRMTKVIPWFAGDFRKTVFHIEAMCKKTAFYESVYAGNLMGMWRDREIVPRDFFGTPKLYRFEHLKLYGVEKADEYLTNVYGDWRELPPVEKRKSDHSYLYIDLDHSYREGQKRER